MAYYPRAAVVLTVLLEDWADGSGNDTLTVEVVPRTLEWVRNHAREADTFRVSVDWRDLPIDPRAARSILVTAAVADAGTAGGTLRYDRSNAVVMGYADEPRIVLDDGAELLEMSGRDYTALFLDKRWGGGAIDITRPLSAVVADILRQTPGASGMLTSLEPGAESLVLKGLVGRKHYVPQPSDDTWTVLVDLVGRAGLIAVVELDTLRILSPGGVGDRRVSFAWGRDISKLKVGRDFQEMRTAQVEVRCWNPATRATLTAKHPSEPIVLRKRISPKGKVTTDNAPVTPFYFEGTYTQAQLATLAERIYRNMARQQLDGELETAELTSFEGEALPQLANGDRVIVEWSQDYAAVIHGRSAGEAVDYLVRSAGLPVGVADTLVRQYGQAAELAVEFYVRAARHRWDRNDGYGLTVEFINLVGGGGAL